MKLNEVKQFLYDLVSMYHPKAVVVWAKTGGVKPKPPYITLSHGALDKSAFPLTDDEGNSFYNYSMIFEVNLYTLGKKVTVGSNAYYENTAVEDLEEFVRFVDSDGITDMTEKSNITILRSSPVNDLSELIDDVKFNYRSMVEFTVNWMDMISGKYAVGNSEAVPNPSGGGTKEFAEAELYTIEKVIIEEEET